jgi:porphobilinogen synthase
MLVAPLFVQPGRARRDAIASMPGQARLSPDLAAEEAARLAGLGVGGVILFGLPESKDPMGIEASADDGIVQDTFGGFGRSSCRSSRSPTHACASTPTTATAARSLRMARSTTRRPFVRLAETAVHPGSGGRRHRCAERDDRRPGGRDPGGARCVGFQQIPIMAYASKHASAFYGPFREAADSAPAFGDGGATRWTRPTAARRSERWISTLPRAPTSCS